MVRTGHPRRWNRTECLTFRVCNTRHNGLATGRLAFRCFLSHSANNACRLVRIHYYNTFVFLVVFNINIALHLFGSSQSCPKSRLRKNPPEWFSSTLLLINNDNNNNNKNSPKWFSSTLLLIRDGQARRKRLIKKCARAFISLSSFVFQSSSCCGMFRSLCCLL